MLNIEQIEEWLGQEVLDSAGERVGKLEDVYYSSHGGEPLIVSVKSGLLGRHVDLAPLAGASVGRDFVRLAYTRAQIEDAGGDGGTEGALDEHRAADLGTAYGIELPGGLESASSINARREAAREAEQRAAALEQEAAKRREEAEDARGTAQDASSQAGEKETAAARAAAEAEQARAEVQQIGPQRPS